MLQSKFAEDQIVDVVKRAEAGTLVKDLCQKIGVGTATWY